MDTNSIQQSEDADMSNCDGEKVVTMMDVLQEQQDFEEDANAVLGASDEKDCTYSKGYIKRQALYACMTCCSDSKTDPTKQAGICLACSLNCHENHELIELYTKRNFRCDCGNPNFNSHPCQFTPEKPDLNEDNNYNQNFSGLYCTCKRPYPDPDNPVEDEMIQCIVCEDWLHSSHLDATLPNNDQYAEMICKICMDKNEFLHDYSAFAVNSAENEDVDVTNESTLLESSLLNGDSSIIEKCNGNGDTKAIEESETNNISMESEQIEKKENTDMEMPDDTINKQRDEEKSEVSTADSENKDQSDLETNTDSKLNEQNIEGSKPVDETATPTEEKTENVNESQNKEDAFVSEKTESETDGSKVNPEVADNSPVEKENPPVEEADNKETAETVNNEEKEEKVEENTKDIETKPQEEKMDSNSTAETKLDESISIKNKIEDTEPNSEKKLDETTPDTENSNQEIGAENKNGDANMNPQETAPTPDHSTENITDSPQKRKLFTDESSDVAVVKKPKLDGSCVRPKGQKRIFKGATFWPANFRQKLCTCNECTTMYKDLSVLYLIDPEDTVSAYETLGKEKINGAPTQYEKGLQALSSLDRVQQINALTEYNNMRDKLLDFLKSFKDRKEVVKEEDIKAFFAGMKPKREPDGVYFCR